MSEEIFPKLGFNPILDFTAAHAAEKAVLENMERFRC
jgi:hypothetical protein